MNFLNIINNCLRCTSFLLVLFNMVLPLYAGVSYAVNVTSPDDSDGIDGIIDGYINKGNTITITVTFDGVDATTYNGGNLNLDIAWSNSGIPDINNANATDISDGISGGTATITITDDQIANENESGDGSYLDRFDFKLIY